MHCQGNLKNSVKQIKSFSEAPLAAAGANCCRIHIAKVFITGWKHPMRFGKRKSTFLSGMPQASNYPTHAKSIKALGPKVNRKKKPHSAVQRKRNKKYIEKIIEDQYSIWTPRPD